MKIKTENINDNNKINNNNESNNEIILRYNINNIKDKKIKIFGENFVDNNKNNF